MFKHTVTYHDFNNKPRTEDVYFHMMVPEWADLEFNPTFEEGGGLHDYMKQAMKSGDGRKIYTFFKVMVVNSFGRRSEDGSKFIKKPEFTEEFLNSPAWEQFFIWLTDDPKNAELFWNGIFPESMKDKVKELEAAQGATPKKALRDMTQEELVELFEKRIAEKAAAAEAS